MVHLLHKSRQCGCSLFCSSCFVWCILGAVEAEQAASSCHSQGNTMPLMSQNCPHSVPCRSEVGSTVEHSRVVRLFHKSRQCRSFLFGLFRVVCSRWKQSRQQVPAMPRETPTKPLVSRNSPHSVSSCSKVQPSSAVGWSIYFTSPARSARFFCSGCVVSCGVFSGEAEQAAISCHVQRNTKPLVSRNCPHSEDCVRDLLFSSSAVECSRVVHLFRVSLLNRERRPSFLGSILELEELDFAFSSHMNTLKKWRRSLSSPSILERVESVCYRFSLSLAICARSGVSILRKRDGAQCFFFMFLQCVPLCSDPCQAILLTN